MMMVETMTESRHGLTEAVLAGIATTPEDMKVAAAFLKNKKS